MQRLTNWHITLILVALSLARAVLFDATMRNISTAVPYYIGFASVPFVVAALVAGSKFALFKAMDRPSHFHKDFNWVAGIVLAILVVVALAARLVA